MPVSDMHAETPVSAAPRRLRSGRWRKHIGLGGATLALVAGSAAWLDRERLAGDFIDDYLAARGVPATYRIVALGPRTQVIEDLVIGDPARPDLTAKAMVIELGVGWAGPEVRRVRLESARLFATWRGGKASLGALDPLIFTDSDAPPALPAFDLVLRDARALVESDVGNIGIKIEGSGRLDDGFAGQLAATAPRLGTEACRAARATLYGAITTRAGKASMNGPLRIAGLACGGAGLASADVGTRITLARDFASAKGDLRIVGNGLAGAGLSARRLSGTGQVSWSGEGLVAAHDLALEDITAPQARLARLTVEGSWRAGKDPARGAWQGRLGGEGLAADNAFDAMLAEAGKGLEGTLLAPLLARVRGGLTRSLEGAAFRTEALVRHRPGEAALVIPEASIAASSGERIFALSQFSARLTGGTLSDLKGNLLAGGGDLPAISGRIGSSQDGGWALRLAMAEYRAGENRLAIPRLTLHQDGRGGALRFAGLVTADGALPGGSVRGLEIPLEGTVSSSGALALGTDCAGVRFAALSLSGLALAGNAITLCPEGGGAVLTWDEGLRLAARTGKLALAGTLGESPASLAADRLVLRYPEPFLVEGLSARIGAPGNAVQLAAASLTGSLSGGIAGDFTGGTARLDVVPLDLDALSGRWSFAEGVLSVEEGAFSLSDRPAEGEARFAPLAAEGAKLSLDGDTILARAQLRHPATRREIASVDIRHDLASARGGARLSVPGLVFDASLQPAELLPQAAGVIALADGRVTGTGRIDWQGDDLSSSGSFASEGLDFAAAFGPVRGLRGRVDFSDLINLTTAPGQELSVAAINPGVEVLAGRIRFALEDGTRLTLEDARWPFMGGTLVMRPLAMDFARNEERRYVFEIIGLDAAAFVAEMELTNLSATGTFDGTVPIVFDAEGNGRIDRGVLIARPGGGNVAYIGELTYEDLGAMGNYAFAALRSLDYRQMSVGLDGSLGGEIITNFDFDGVRQGAGTSQNFVTRRLARLPIRFKVNVRSENFYELSTMVRSFWDIDYLGSPVDRGLLKAEGGRFVPANPSRQSVQPAESEDQP